MSAGMWSLVRKGTTHLVVRDLEVADTVFHRFRGLQFRKALPVGSGLLLVPCSSVHTVGVLFPIDVVMLGGAGTVLDVRRNVPPFRAVFGPKGTHAVLELPANTADLQPGEHVRLTPAAGKTAAPPKSLNFLWC